MYCLIDVHLTFIFYMYETWWKPYSNGSQTTCAYHNYLGTAFRIHIYGPYTRLAESEPLAMGPLL